LGHIACLFAWDFAEWRGLGRSRTARCDQHILIPDDTLGIDQRYRICPHKRRGPFTDFQPQAKSPGWRIGNRDFFDFSGIETSYTNLGPFGEAVEVSESCVQLDMFAKMLF